MRSVFLRTRKYCNSYSFRGYPRAPKIRELCTGQGLRSRTITHSGLFFKLHSLQRKFVYCKSVLQKFHCEGNRFSEEFFRRAKGTFSIFIPFFHSFPQKQQEGYFYFHSFFPQFSSKAAGGFQSLLLRLPSFSRMLLLLRARSVGCSRGRFSVQQRVLAHCFSSSNQSNCSVDTNKSTDRQHATSSNSENDGLSDRRQSARFLNARGVGVGNLFFLLSSAAM